MTEVNQEIKGTPGSLITPLVKSKNENNTFTIRQSVLLILLTLLLSVGGWYAVGKYYVWTDIDIHRVNQQLEFYQQKVLSDPSDAKARVELG